MIPKILVKQKGKTQNKQKISSYDLQTTGFLPIFLDSFSKKAPNALWPRLAILFFWKEADNKYL